MATIHLQIIDTASGGVAVHHSFRPAVGHPLSPAQGYALDLIAQIHRTWGAGSVVLTTQPPPQPTAPAPATASTLKLGDIGRRLGFDLLTVFVANLGFDPSDRIKAAMLSHEADFARVCTALIDHLERVRGEQTSVVATQPPPQPPAPAQPPSIPLAYHFEFGEDTEGGVCD